MEWSFDIFVIVILFCLCIVMFIELFVPFRIGIVVLSILNMFALRNGSVKTVCANFMLV